MSASAFANEPADPYLWLEEVTGEKQLEWVRGRNAACVAALASTDRFKTLEARIRGILDSKERIPMVSKIGDRFYNVWRDAANPKGLWRRTTLDEYRKPDPAWETVLDLDVLSMRPDLFGGIVCQVPLLDMRRYHRLLAGASWMGEYGNPDSPEEWEFIRGFSPYHNLDRERTYPPILITTSTRDDRVHPGHARKMTARLEELGKQVLSYENIEGGHGGAADNLQRAFMDALGYTFLDRELQ